MEVKEIHTKRYKLPSDSERAAAKTQMDKMRKEGEKLVKGMFEFVDAQGGWLDYNYRFFPGEPIRTVRINHGEIVELPMILVRHLNNIWKKVQIPNSEISENGKIVRKKTYTKISRTRFTPMDVM